MTEPTEFDPTTLGNAGRRHDPIDVAQDPSLTTDKKRALLASWASDARAGPDHPALRRLDDGRIVRLDDVLDVLDALKAIDDPEPSGPPADAREVPSILRGPWSRLGRPWRKGRDDDDDNPPTAPAALRPNRPNIGGALAAVA